MYLSTLPTTSSLLSVFFLLALSLAAPPGDAKSASDVTAEEPDAAEQDLVKRMSGFVRIGRPNGFVRIGKANNFIRHGRPGNFVRIGRGYEGEEDDHSLSALEAAEGEDYGHEDDKRMQGFVRIGKAPNNFVRIGKSDLQQALNPETKRMSSFVRIGREPYGSSLETDDVSKRASSFVRIGRIPSSAFVRIGREPGASEEQDEYDAFDRIARMGQSSFVRIGKRETKPENMPAPKS